TRWRASWQEWLHASCQRLQRSRRYRHAQDDEARAARLVCREYVWPDPAGQSLASIITPLARRNDAITARELFDAIADGDLGPVREGVRTIGPNAEVDGVTALAHAVEHDAIAASALLMNPGEGPKADVNRPSRFGVTPLYRAALRGSLPLTRLLLSAGANVDRADISQVTPLMAAAQTGSVEVTEALLDAHANINAVDVAGRTALMRAAMWDRTDVVKVLLSHHADVTHESTLYTRSTALTDAVKFGHGASAELLRNALDQLSPERRGADLREPLIEWTLRVDLSHYIPPRFVAAEILVWQDQFAHHKGTELRYRKFLAEANRGDAFAEFLIGRANAYGLGTRRDLKAAAAWYRKSAEQGEPLGQAFYAFALQRADGVQQNAKEALVWINRAAAASTVGNVYLALFGETDCKRVGMSCSEVTRGLEEATKNGDGVAYNILGYRLDYDSGSSPSPDQQAKLLAAYRASAVADDVPGVANYGLWLVSGWAQTRNVEKGIENLEHAANLGYAPAMRNLGNIYFTGLGRKQSFAKAYEWYEKAAKASPGDAFAEGYAAMMLEQGLGVKASPEEAVVKYRKSSKVTGHGMLKLRALGLLP
ncbi:MAG TPA: ankyrin repeat domain-containing protein, partial [Thermoanaerobaculia bacterium]